MIRSIVIHSCPIKPDSWVSAVEPATPENCAAARHAAMAGCRLKYVGIRSGAVSRARTVLNINVRFTANVHKTRAANSFAAG